MHPVSSVARCFERRFLFGYGRHFWNFMGVVGFGIMATGAIFAIDGLNKKQYAPVNKSFFPGWYCSMDHMVLLQKRDRSNPFRVIETIFANEEKLRKTAITDKFWFKPCNRIGFKVNDAGTQISLYPVHSGRQIKTYSQLKQLERVITPYPSNTLKDYREQAKEIYDELVSNQNKVQGENLVKNIRLGLSLPIAAYGLAVVAGASLMSATLSIERNTRND